jgi:hypothetical protein
MAPAEAAVDGVPPFVEVFGRRFYADRCYLNEMVGADRRTGSIDSTDDDGVQLFSRAALVASLAASGEGLEACVLTTFSLELPDMEAELPALFGASSRVPTLLLHGDRCVRRGYAEEVGGAYRVWKEVAQENANVERPRGYQPGPFWCYEAMDGRAQVRCGARETRPGPIYGGGAGSPSVHREETINHNSPELSTHTCLYMISPPPTHTQ